MVHIIMYCFNSITMAAIHCLCMFAGDIFPVVLRIVVPSVASFVILGTVGVAVILSLVLRRKRGIDGK